jgi:ATP-dependent Lon protease
MVHHQIYHNVTIPVNFRFGTPFRGTKCGLNIGRHVEAEGVEVRHVHEALGNPSTAVAALQPTLQLLLFSRWDKALAWLVRHTNQSSSAISPLNTTTIGPDNDSAREFVSRVVEDLHASKSAAAGQLALAWQMLTVDPAKPCTFWPVMPLLQRALDDAPIDKAMRRSLRLDDRMEIWWRAAAGDFVDHDRPLSVFALAERGVAAGEVFVDPVVPAQQRGVVVMPKAKAAKIKTEHAAFSEMLDHHLPLALARDIADVRRTLLSEYPHAAVAVDLLLRDLREGEPVRLKPVILCGPPGNGKSRLVRRLGDLLSIGVYRFDGGSSADGVGFGGTPRGWSESTPSVPARAVQQFRLANPICMVDEIEKASQNPRSGGLWSALLAHLDHETSARFRDASLDAELDLSWVSHIATANSIEPLSAPLKDRYRIVKVPAPRLVDLPVLATNVMRNLAAEAGEEGFMQALANDELDVIAKAWQPTGFSIRKLQKIVGATVEARNAGAIRH